MNELHELEKLDSEIHRRKAEMARLEDQQKILAKEAAQLNRRQRTRRLCIRGGMLESFLGVPELLNDEQVMTLLKLAFNTSVVVNQLSIYLTEVYRKVQRYVICRTAASSSTRIISWNGAY